MQNYVVGLAFDVTKSYIVLIEKNKPAWQAGKLNGIGGKVEANELPSEAMSREFLEETGVETSPEDWTLQCQLSGKDFTVDVYRIFTDDIFQAETMEDEKVVIYSIGLDLITEKGISNLPWLVAMALDEDAERFQPTISYVNK